MESKRFAEIFERLHEKEMGLLSLKGQDYATDDERLENFILAAGMLHQRPSQIALEYLTKHYIAVINEIAKDSGDLVWSYVINGEVKEGFIQKVCDARNYLGLMLCCLEQERGVKADFGQVQQEETVPLTVSALVNPCINCDTKECTEEECEVKRQYLEYKAVRREKRRMCHKCSSFKLGSCRGFDGDKAQQEVCWAIHK